MSDLSVLSDEYKTTAKLAETLNRAVIVLKKVHQQLPGHETIKPGELEEQRCWLANVVRAIAEMLGAGSGRESEGEDSERVSGAIVARLMERHSGDLSYYIQDLLALASSLSGEPPSLTDDGLAILDELAAVADAETSSVFRHMMRH